MTTATRRKTKTSTPAEPAFKIGDEIICEGDINVNDGRPFRATVAGVLSDGLYLTTPGTNERIGDVLAVEFCRKARSSPAAYAAYHRRRYIDRLASARNDETSVITRAARELSEAADPGNYAYAGRVIENAVAPVMKASAVLKELAWLPPTAEPTAATDAESLTRPTLREQIAEVVEGLTRTILADDGYRHNSTCEAVSIHNRMQFKAKQDARQLLLDLAYHLDAAAECDAWHAEGRLEIGEIVADRSW
jgi:hypothetical protein